MYDLEIKPEADEIFRKISRKDPNQLFIIHRKIESIRLNPKHKYKFLKRSLQNFNRVHIAKHFVLIFRVNHQRKTIEIYYYSHHDNVYKWRTNSFK